MSLSRKDRRAVIFGGIGLLVICMANYVILPWWDGWMDVRKQIGKDRQQVDQMEVKVCRVLGQRRRLADRYGQGVNAPLKDVENARVTLYEEAQKVFSRNQFAVENYQPQMCKSLKDVPGVHVVPLQVRGKCRDMQLYQCLAKLCEAQSLIFVDRLIVTNPERRQGNLDVTIVLSTLAERDEEEGAR